MEDDRFQYVVSRLARWAFHIRMVSGKHASSMAQC